MNAQITPATVTHPDCTHAEAPVSANTEFLLNGVAWRITMRDGTTAHKALALLRECYKVQEALAKAGATFVLTRDAREMLERQQRATPPEQPPAPSGNGHNGHQPQPAEDNPGWCVLHQVEMKRWDKDGRAWYSHKLDDGGWCRGKAKNGNGNGNGHK